MLRTGHVVLLPIGGVIRERIHAIQLRFDPKVAAAQRPHVTLAGSSGVGPILPGPGAAELRAALSPITETTPPLTLHLGRPHRYMQTDILVLPLDPHGPLRTLHERIARSGLRFAPSRFPPRSSSSKPGTSSSAETLFSSKGPSTLKVPSGSRMTTPASAKSAIPFERKALQMSARVTRFLRIASR